MEPVLRAVGCYLLLLFVVRLSGKRGLAQVTIFDLVLLLLISQTVGQALIGNDSSLTTAAIITITLVVINRADDTVAQGTRRGRRRISRRLRSPAPHVAAGSVSIDVDAGSPTRLGSRAS